MQKLEIYAVFFFLVLQIQRFINTFSTAKIEKLDFWNSNNSTNFIYQ